MPRVCKSHTGGERDASGARQSEREHPPSRVGNGEVPRGEPTTGGRQTQGEEEEEEAREESEFIMQLQR